MSDLFARMINRAAGRSPVVRTATPHLAPAPLAMAEALPVIGEERVAASPTSAPVPVQATSVRAATPASALPPSERSAQPLVPPAHSETAIAPRPAEVVAAPVAPAARPQAVEAQEPLAPPRIAPLAPLPAPLEPSRAAAITPPATVSSEPTLVASVEAPIAERLVVPHAPVAPLVDVTTRASTEPQEERITPPRPRVLRTTPMMPKLDLRQALDAVGRALAEPPRPRPAPAAQSVTSESDREEVHITIGHIDVRAASPAAAAPAQPARRSPSITLAEYLRRPPGSPR